MRGRKTDLKLVWISVYDPRAVKPRIAVWVISASLLLLTAARAAPPTVTPAALNDASEVVEREMKEQQIPGAALVVMNADEIILARGYGREDVGRDHPVTENTVFGLGSIAKQFVAAAVLQLAETGKLSLNDSAAQHLPQFTSLPPELKIHHLLSHTSGMREEFRQPDLRELFDKPGTTFAEYVEAASDAPSDWTPGSRWSYSNMNYLMLTVLIERVTGKALEAALAERFFEPLGLKSLHLCPFVTGEAPGNARGHILRDGKFLPHPPENVTLFRGSGGYCGSAVDIARWARALASGKIISKRSYEQMTTRAPLSNERKAEYGFAMDLGSHDGVQRNGHGGYGGGFSAQAAYYPDAELTVVVVTNRNMAFPEHIERKISRRLLGLPEPVRREVPLAADELKRYAGDYDVGIPDWFVQTRMRDGRLWFELPSPPIKLPLVHIGKHEFVSADDVDGYRLTFSEDGPGRELRLVGMGMMTWYGVRRP